MVRKMEQPDGALIFDDTIEEKPHTDENEIVSWHFDHSKNRTLKGINILNCVYHAQGMTLPVAYEIIRKPMVFKDENTGRLKRRGEVSKNELMRRMDEQSRRDLFRRAYAARSVETGNNNSYGYAVSGWAACLTK